MGHPTMQENDTAKLTPTCTFYYGFEYTSISISRQME